MFDNLQFQNLEYFWFMLVIPPMIFWYWYRNRSRYAELKLPTLEGIKSMSSWRVYLRPLLFAFRLAAIALLITAFARPQSDSSEKEVTTEGIDIVIAHDVSGSMLAEDFKPNRLGAAKKNAIEFISNRPDDRIGLVVFAGESFAQAPLTTDTALLKKLVGEIRTGLMTDMTAIGLGLSNCVNLLRDSEAKSKVVILLTDGVNNFGDTSPISAAEAAIKFDVRIYTIGVGTIGQAMVPVKTPVGVRRYLQEVRIDEDLLREVAKMTGGKYFRATGNTELMAIYEDIDKLEKSLTETSILERNAEEFLDFALLAFLFLVIEIFLRYTLFKTVT